LTTETEETEMTHRLDEQHPRRARAPADGVSTRSASLGLRLQPELKAELVRRAAATKVTLNYLVESILAEHLARTGRKGGKS
jgi:predicted HicB family RNase H-like nuclease